MSAMTYLLDRDTPPFLWSGDYTPILKHGGNKFEIINELRNLLTGKFRMVLRLSKIHSMVVLIIALLDLPGYEIFISSNN